MDKSLLKRTAIQSMALMIAVITFSYAGKQYQSVTIQASGQINTEVETGYDTPSSDGLTNINVQADKPKAQLTISQQNADGTDQNILHKLGNNYFIVKKPEGEQVSLTLEDLYINQSIRLTISGTSSAIFTKNMITRVRGDQHFVGEPVYTESKSVEYDEHGKAEEVVTRDYKNDLCHGITITTSQDKQSKLFTEKVLLELDSIYAYIIYEDSNNYYIDFKKPSEVYDKILVIDAGHGGKDVGAMSKNEEYFEKNINLDIVKDLKMLLDNEKIKVYYTRFGDDTVYLRPRSSLANAVDCDYFISIHCNANEVTYPNGTEVLYYNNAFKGVKNSDLAKLFSEEVSKTISLKKRGPVEKHPEDIYIMDKAVVPMVLIEVGYLTNSNDMNYLSKQSNRMAVAQGIYNGIMKAYEKLPDNKGQ